MRRRDVRLWCQILSAMLALSCMGDAIVWSDPMTTTAQPDGRLTVDARGRALFVIDTSTSVTPVTSERICPGSVRAARQRDATLVATWWSVRDDSSAVLLAAVSPDGGRTWNTPLRVDTVDVSRTGCQRPPPAIAASAGFVHIGYAMQGPEGTGVFYAHSMTLGSTYEPAVAVIYGERLTAVDVAADEGVVAVAYEEPSGKNPQIGLAISRDWGHIFGDRVRGSTGIGAAAMPQVAVRGRQIAVSWLQRSREANVSLPVTRIVRVGRLP